jgi:hypothetical protein
MKKNIPGIHNYCDRWCERCHFTSRCAVYEKTSDIPLEEQDIQNKAFWDRIANTFEEAFELLRKAAEEQGINLNDISPEEEQNYRQETKKKRKIAEDHPLTKLCYKYAKDAEEWLKNNYSLQEKGATLIQNVELGIQTQIKTRQILNEIKDSLEIVQWYVLFICVKFMRAISGKLDDDGWEEENGFQKDADGSAKIALIAVDRSMQAWSQLYRHFAQDDDDILLLLSQLQKIKTMAEKEFPDAWKFVRAGFDK